MTMQSACHDERGGGEPHHAARRALRVAALVGLWVLCSPAMTADSVPAAHDYPTHARVEYVNDCITRTGGRLSNLYQCSCAIDRIAAKLSYDDYVEASTFAKYVSLGGEGGAIFRDSQHAKEMVKLYRGLEEKAFEACGLDAGADRARR